MKRKTKEVIEEYARDSITVPFAKQICESYDIDFDDSLIYTKPRYREMVDEETPRVAMYDLVRHISFELHLLPNKELLEKAHKMLGVGSMAEYTTKAYMYYVPNNATIDMEE